MRALWLPLIALCLLSAETLDRLAVTVGSTVITELQIDEDLRVAALLNNQPLSRDAESRRAAADRLVEQLLIQHEIRLSHYPPPTEQEISMYFSHIEETMGGAGALKQLLTRYNISEDTLRAHLIAQLATLRFIEVRFTPDITLTDAEIDAAYQRQIAAWKAANPGRPAPPLDNASREKLTQMLIAERTDAALNTWLAESRKQVNIVYLDSSLQ